MSEEKTIDTIATWEGNTEVILPPDNNNPIYTNLSDKTKKFILEVGLDVQSMYTALEHVDNLLDGKISEDEFLRYFYGRYRPSKCNYMNEEN